MTHVTPFILQAGRGVQGSSLGYHAYSLRVDNISNQWLQEESTLVWIPPYSLGVVVRLWGTGVALLIPSAPVGQPQLAPITGEYAVAVYSDEFRAENPGVPVRQFTLVQSVTDLQEGPQPALPPVGVDRLYADSSGNIHHLHSDGTDLMLVDRSNVSTSLYPVSDPHYQAMMSATALGGDLNGTVAVGHVNQLTIDGSGNWTLAHNLSVQGGLYPNAGISCTGAIGATNYITTGSYFNLPRGQYLQWDTNLCSIYTNVDNIFWINIYNSGVYVRNSYNSAVIFQLDGAGTITGPSSAGIIQYGTIRALSGFVAQNGNAGLGLESGYNISCYGSALGTWIARSDRRLKENLVEVSDEACLAQLDGSTMSVYGFTWRNDESQAPQSGFIADEVYADTPVYANVDEDGVPNAINYSQMVPTLWAAMRALSARVQKLEAA